VDKEASADADGARKGGSLSHVVDGLAGGAEERRDLAVSGVMPPIEFCEPRIAVPTVPKISIAKDGHSTSRKYDVRPSWKFRAIDPIP
jgi:hypothetical protein